MSFVTDDKFCEMGPRSTVHLLREDALQAFMFYFGLYFTCSHASSTETAVCEHRRILYTSAVQTNVKIQQVHVQMTRQISRDHWNMEKSHFVYLRIITAKVMVVLHDCLLFTLWNRILPPVFHIIYSLNAWMKKWLHNFLGLTVLYTWPLSMHAQIYMKWLIGLLHFLYWQVNRIYLREGDWGRYFFVGGGGGEGGW